MDEAIERSILSLALTPRVLQSTFLMRPDSWLDSRHSDDVLSPREAVGHLVQGEREDWMPRIRKIIESGEAEPFTPFDPFKDQELSNRTALDVMLAEFRRLRSENLRALRELDLTEDLLEKRGTHPRHGSVTLRQLIHTWAAHDLYHLGQIYKSFSVDYVERIGPWQSMLNLPHFN